MEGRNLYRSTKNKVLCGVCGGLGEYFKVDPTFIRLIWVIVILCRPERLLFHYFFEGSVIGTSILIYIIAAVIIPTGHSTLS